MVQHLNAFLTTGLLLVNVFIPVNADNNASELLPSVRARITQKGLDYGAKLIVDFITKNPHKMYMPAIPVTVGGTTMTLSNIVIRRFPRPLLQIFLMPNESSAADSYDGSGGSASDGRSRLQVNITNLNPTVDATLKIVQSLGFLKIEREVNITTTLTRMFLSIKAYIGIDEDGRPAPSDIQCHATGDTLSFVLKGEYSRWTWFVNRVYSTMENQFRDTVFSQVCSNLVLEVNKFLDNELKNLSMTADFEDLYTFDYRLVAEPKVAERFLETSLKCRTTSLKDAEEPELQLTRIPSFPRHVEKMVYVYLTDSAANSAWYAAMTNGHLNITIAENTADVPEAFRRYLSTTCPGSTCLGTILPHLALSHPNSVATVDIRAVNTSYVPFRFRGRSIGVRCKGVVDFYIHASESDQSDREKILSVSVTLGATVEMNITREKLHFTIPDRSFRVDGDILSTSVHYAAFAPFAEPLFDTYLTVVSSYVILPALQAIGYRGLPLQLPTVPDLHFVNPSFVVHNAQHLLAIGTDVDYTVPKLD